MHDDDGLPLQALLAPCWVRLRMRCRVALRSYIVCVTARVPTPRTTTAPNSPSDTRDALVVERRCLRALDGCAALSCCSAFRYVDYAAGDDLLGYLLVSEGETRICQGADAAIRGVAATSIPPHPVLKRPRPNLSTRVQLLLSILSPFSISAASSSMHPQPPAPKLQRGCVRVAPSGLDTTHVPGLRVAWSVDGREDVLATRDPRAQFRSATSLRPLPTQDERESTFGGGTSGSFLGHCPFPATLAIIVEAPGTGGDGGEGGRQRLKSPIPSLIHAAFPSSKIWFLISNLKPPQLRALTCVQQSRT
ncbi:hypothetical protein B0H14DRAFT_2575869 [Mycena olivaceomarginata]|nr:hypothetical protein B0H14DRAFT_2575869 [Mycena olivaceomarginata]